jgi:hypothetical protein
MFTARHSWEWFRSHAASGGASYWYDGSVQAYDETQAEFIMLVRRVDDLIAARRL